MPGYKKKKKKQKHKETKILMAFVDLLGALQNNYMNVVACCDSLFPVSCLSLLSNKGEQCQTRKILKK